MTETERTELELLRAAFKQAAEYGEPGAAEMARLIELERAEVWEQAAERYSTPVHRHTPGCGHFNSEYEL